MTYEGMPFPHGSAFLLTAFYAVWLHVISLPVLRISNKRTAFFLLDQLSITLICVHSYDLSYNVYLFPIGL